MNSFTPGSPEWADQLGRLADSDPGSRRTELRRLAHATRCLIDGLVMTEASEETLRAAADAIEATAAHFGRPEGAQRPPTLEGFGEASTSGNPYAFFDHSPMLGVSNPVAPPISLRRTGEREMTGTVTFGSAYEGPPGCVHGGFVAAAFDEVLGAAQSFSGQPGMTGTLVVRYRFPTPLHEELRFTASFDRVEGRKVLTSGAVHAGDRLCAEAEAVFVSLRPGRMEELRRERAQQEARPPAAGTDS
jgi:acyl-coenzyme A thioesterase PaaI-like protein